MKASDDSRWHADQYAVCTCFFADLAREGAPRGRISGAQTEPLRSPGRRNQLFLPPAEISALIIKWAGEGTQVISDQRTIFEFYVAYRGCEEVEKEQGESLECVATIEVARFLTVSASASAHENAA